jgi:hypothetical protein
LDPPEPVYDPMPALLPYIPRLAVSASVGGSGGRYVGGLT